MTYYIYLRKLQSRSNSEDAIAELIASIDSSHIEELHFSDETSWTDGFVFQAQSHLSPTEFFEAIKDHAGQFDGWAAHDGGRHFKEHSAAGVLGWFCGRASGRFAQIFTMGDNRGDRHHGMEKLRAALKGTCVPVFEFANGHVTLFDSKQSSSLIFERCRSARVLDHFEELIVIDSEDVPCSIEGREPDVWRTWALSDDSYD